MKEAEESGKVIARTHRKLITNIIPDASQGVCGTDGGFHLPKPSLEFLLAASLWGSQSVCFSEAQFMVGQDSERRVLVPLEQKLNILWTRATESF